MSHRAIRRAQGRSRNLGRPFSLAHGLRPSYDDKRRMALSDPEPSRGEVEGPDKIQISSHCLPCQPGFTSCASSPALSTWAQALTSINATKIIVPGRHAEQPLLIPLLRSSIPKNWRPFLMRVSEKRKSRGGREGREKRSFPEICKPYTNSQNDKSLDPLFPLTAKLSLLQSCPASSGSSSFSHFGFRNHP